jgi:hypothetical protein
MDGTNMCVCTNAKAQRIYEQCGFEQVVVVPAEEASEGEGEGWGLEIRLLEYKTLTSASSQGHSKTGDLLGLT